MRKLLSVLALVLAASQASAQITCTGGECRSNSVVANDCPSGQKATGIANGGTLTCSAASSNATEEVGTLPVVTGLSASEYGNGALHRTTLTFTNVNLATTDSAGVAGYGGLKIYSFPLGKISCLASMAHLTIARVGTGLTATSAIVMSLGSVTAAADATLTGTEVDYLFSGAATLSSGAGLYSTHQTGAPLSNIKNGTTTDHSGVPYDVYLDMATPDAGSTGNDALTVNGTVILTWTKLGDY